MYNLSLSTMREQRVSNLSVLFVFALSQVSTRIIVPTARRKVAPTNE